MLIYWFSNRCPFFTVFDAERYLRLSQKNSIEFVILKELGLRKAALWFLKNEEKWKRFVDNIPSEIEVIKKAGGNLLFWGDEKYPEKLKYLYHPPAMLFYKGDIDLFQSPTVAIVGSRKPTELGRVWIKKIMPELIEKQIVIVSGGARGIDYEAHFNAMECKGKTVAFLPGGVLNPYPSSNGFLFSRIIEKRGLLVSEFVTSDFVRRENFHQRNRLIAGSVDLLVVVEAALKSGTSMTANKALDENRDVSILPGSPLMENYQGSLQLLFQGAGVARHAQDIVDILWKKNVLKKSSESPTLSDI